MKKLFFTIFILVFISMVSLADQPINLSGNWRFTLDKTDVGIAEKWFETDLKDKINLPGILQSQGFGNEISTKTPWVLSLYDKFWFLREGYKHLPKTAMSKFPFSRNRQNIISARLGISATLKFPQLGQIRELSYF